MELAHNERSFKMSLAYVEFREWSRADVYPGIYSFALIYFLSRIPPSVATIDIR